MKTTLKSYLFILLASSVLVMPAQAQDVPPVAAAIFKSWESQLKATPAYDKIETDASGNVTITNLTANLGVSDPTSGAKLTIGSIKLENVAAEANGIIEVGNATFSDTKMEITGSGSKSFQVEMANGTAENWYVSVLPENPTPLQAFRATMGIARKMASSEIKISTLGQTYSSQGAEISWDGDPVTGAGKSTINIKDIVIPEAAMALMDPTGQMKALGYNSITLNLSGDGELAVSDSGFGMSGSVLFSSKDMAGLKLSYGTSDIPLSLMTELQAAQKAGREPNFNSLMPQLMNVSISNFQFRFEDASITKKVLPLIAKMQGMSEAAMVANAGAMMQIGLMQLKSQAFTDQVVKSVNAFLADPKSITVSLKPAAPVKVQQVMTLDPNNPAAAIDLLGVTVTAND